MASLAAQQRPVLCTFLYPPRCLTSTSARLAAYSNKGKRNVNTSQAMSFTVRATALPRHISRRAFSQSTRLARDEQREAESKFRAAAMAANRMRDPSITNKAKEEMKKVVTAQGWSLDAGLLPNTLVIPPFLSSGGHLPSPFSTGRLRLEWKRVKERARDLLALIQYKYYAGPKGKERPKILVSDLDGTARRLHYDMWSAFARGDAAALKEVCCSGLLESLKGRIGRRGTAERLQWTLHQYNGRTRVVSHRAALMSDVGGVGVRQAVVRIKSRQSLDKVKRAAGKGRPEEVAAASTENAKDMDEYIVLQRVVQDKKEGPWMIWGTTQETDLAPIVAGAK